MARIVARHAKTGGALGTQPPGEPAYLFLFSSLPHPSPSKIAGRLRGDKRRGTGRKQACPEDRSFYSFPTRQSDPDARGTKTEARK